jgi:hypothetical protein
MMTDRLTHHHHHHRNYHHQHLYHHHHNQIITIIFILGVVFNIVGGLDLTLQEVCTYYQWDIHILINIFVIKTNIIIIMSLSSLI